MKDIKSLLKKLDVEKEAVDKITIFLKTKRGQIFVNKLHTSSLKELSNRYELPKFIRLYNNDTKNMNLILHVIKKENIVAQKPIIIFRTPPATKKLPVSLTKEEIRKIDAHRPKNTLGFAARMHAYEEAKIAKFIKLNPPPTERELKEDLFPKELQDAYNAKLEKRREYIRDFLTSTYHKLTIYGRFKISDGKFVNKKIAEIKDINMGGHRINGISKNHPLIQKTQHIADIYYKHNKNLICVLIKDHYNRLGRIIVPHKYTESINI